MSLLGFLAGVYAIAVIHHLGHRLVRLREREFEARVDGQAGRVTGKIPDDITALAAQYHDEWARDAFLARAHELYEKTNDWGQARLLLEESTR